MHYSKHHQAYVNNFNAALDKYHDAEEKNDVAAMLTIEASISFNGGGHLNHSLFWESLSPDKKTISPELQKGIEKDFGSMDAFKEKFIALAIGVQGSGWVWLGYSKMQDQLRVITTKNHGTISSMGLSGLMILDVWEHAYYLQYKNKRADFVSAIWEIFDWEKVAQRYVQAKN